MDILLTDNEMRVLGCLMEKEMATPDYYPLSLNALINACNQKSNRHPVVSYDEETVVTALNGLQERKLARQSNLSRVPKFEQLFSKDLKLVAREEAIICILLVRGPQTVGEIRGRTERLYAFASLDEVQDTMISLENMALVHKLPRQPGRKESRYAHRLSAEPREASAEAVTRPEAAAIDRRDNERIGELQDQIDELRQKMEHLQVAFDNFTAQFD
jgi:uncharacterized protein